MSMPGQRRAEELRLLAEAISNALGVCRVGLAGDAAALVEPLTALGMACPERGPFDAWVLLTDIVRLEQGGELPASTDAHPLFVACYADDSANPAAPLRARIEAAVIHRGYIKHPATTELFGYTQLDASQNECWAIFDFRPPVFADGDTADRLKRERDLHSDMLREPGVRSDAHAVRYQLAASLIRPGDIVLDAACGLGYGSHILASLSPAARVSGIDLSDWAVDFATRNYGSDRVSFVCGSLPEALTDIPDGSVDFVVSLETLEHVSDPVALLAGFERILKPGGRIFVSVPNDWADETGKDPNPHHLHVYDWTRIHGELDLHFIVESAWSLTASGCKSGNDRAWRPQPRKLEQVALDGALATEGEWWLVCATKSPLAAPANTYKSTIHAGFLGRTHLVDFSSHYDCPWLVHSLVELPWRIRDKAALAAIAREVTTVARPGSADLGAGLAVVGWRVLEDSGPMGSVADDWLDAVESYLDTGRENTNPHVRRWCVSLDYLLGRFFEARNEVATAIDAYQRVANADVIWITPTLGTKVADASLRAGMLAFREGCAEDALSFWRGGLAAVFQCLNANPREFIGNLDKPFIFAMNDLVEIADGAVRLANAICAVSACGANNRAASARQLGVVSQSSLRSALAQSLALADSRTAKMNQQAQALNDVQQLAITRYEELGVLARQLDRTEKVKTVAEQLAHAHLSEVERLQVQLVATAEAKAVAETLAIARFEELDVSSKRLDRTEQVKAVAEQLAHSHLSEVARLQVQLVATAEAKAVAETLAIARSEELDMSSKRLDRTEQVKTTAEQLAHAYLAEVTRLQVQLAATEEAKAVAETLAISLYEELHVIAKQLDSAEQVKTIAEQFAQAHPAEVERLQVQLLATAAAKAFAEAMAISRYDELGVLARQLNHTEKVKTVAEQLAYERLSEVERLQVQLLATEKAKAMAETLAIARHEELGVLARRLDRTEQVKTVAEQLAHAHLSEVARLQVQLLATEEAKAIAETLAISRYEQLDVIARQLDRTEQVKTVAEQLAHARLSEVDRLQVRLVATEEAKAIAATLAISRYEELIQLRVKLASVSNTIEQV